jgi:hypothetical protein
MGVPTSASSLGCGGMHDGSSGLTDEGKVQRQEDNREDAAVRP